MTFESRVHGFRLYLLRRPQEHGNHGPRDMPLPDWSGWSVRIEVGSVIDREREAERSGVSRRPHTLVRIRRTPRKCPESLVGRQGLEPWTLGLKDRTKRKK